MGRNLNSKFVNEIDVDTAVPDFLTSAPIRDGLVNDMLLVRLVCVINSTGFFWALKGVCRKEKRLWSFDKPIFLHFSIGEMASKKRKAGKLVSLSPDRRLLDSSFDGYKLSLEAFPKYSTCLESEIDRVVLNQNQYSYQHLKAFATFNHLIADPFNSNVIFAIDKLWKVYKINVQLCSGALQKPYSVFEIPESRTRRQMDGRYHVTLSVFSQDWLVLADGTGFLYIIKTGPRDNDMDLWRIHYSGSPLGEQESSKVEHSHTYEENGRTLLSVLLLSVKGEEEFRTVYNWLTFELDERENWNLIRTRRLEGQSFPDYCCTAGNFLYVSAERPPQFVYDSLQPIVDDNDAADGAETTDKAIPPYYWYQSTEEVVVTVCAPEDITKSDVECTIAKKDILLRINTSTILEGSLYESVSPDESTWTLVDNKLEVTLSKCVNNCWNEVVIGDDRGERIFSAEQAAEIHERLAHLTSNLQNPDPDKGENKPFNSQQLEECDFFPEETSALLRIDGDSHNITHQISLSLSSAGKFKQSSTPVFSSTCP
ncbi:DgyrCDS6538 [Dimorphilus gyrociliatus]|uniref:NudC domain-containing protein 1 n=1 Tax=Dimorphilus gyrociliatus TaxID=2664684 RepID=A0A7I8VQM5_9ANNE|nr:DgyrCDS6538 [Dimorphilus gyrociliatus]